MHSVAITYSPSQAFSWKTFLFNSPQHVIPIVHFRFSYPSLHHSLCEFPLAWFFLAKPALTISQLRLLYILPTVNPTPPLPRKRGSPARLLIVLGSGGHTAEMISLLNDLDPHSYTHRSYVVSSGDDFSARKAADFERYFARKFPNAPESYDISFVPRARKIHQSLLTTPLSSLHCLFACFSVLRSPSAPPSPLTAHTYPDLILTNGPATATILIFACLLLRFFSVPGTSGRMRTIYVESWARVKGLSLSGKILVAVGACERVLVQWEGLSRAGRGEFRGVLVR